MKKQTITTASQLVRALNDHGGITIRGPQALELARRTLEQVLAQSGCAIRFDPASAPDLVDYLTVATMSGLEGAIAGAGLGALVGLLFDRPAAGAAIGAGLGGLAGAGRGVQRVESGWRVHAVRELNGAPIVTIHALKAAWG